MKVTKCDRCGVDIENSKDITITVERKGSTYPVVEMDFCTNCASTFIDWIAANPDSSEKTVNRLKTNLSLSDK